MNLDFLLDYITPAILAICIAVGFVWKNFFPADNKWIPLISAVLGAVLSCLQGITVENLAAGLITGLAATGCYEAFRNLIHPKKEEPIEREDDDRFGNPEGK